MTLTNSHPGSTHGAFEAGLTRTARTTGLLYLGLALTGALGFQLVRGQLYVADDPGATLSNLVEHTATARLGLLLELGIVLTQALAAVWFYRLFRGVDSFAAARMPMLLGQLLIVGGVGYVLGTFVDYVVADAGITRGLLTVSATLGEVWMVGYLIVRGVREHGGPSGEPVRAATS